MSFDFQRFKVEDGRCAMKVGTDGVLLGAWTHVAGNVRRVLDLGAGSGLVSLILAQRSERCRITAVEIDRGAVADCADNFSASPWADRLSVCVDDALLYEPVQAPDLIVSNPPFFVEKLQSPDSGRALARHAGALSPETVIRRSARLLSPCGSVALIMPTACADDIIYLAEMLHLKERRRLDVLPTAKSDSVRTLLQFAREDGDIERGRLILRQDGNTPTEDYRRLTAELYLRL